MSDSDSQEPQAIGLANCEMRKHSGTDGLDCGMSGPSWGPQDPVSTMGQEDIQPDPIEAHGFDIGSDPMPIHLPDLQTMQSFIDALRTAALEDSGMELEDIEQLRSLEPECDLEDLSPLLRSLRHFINNLSASWDHYDTTRCIKLLNNPDGAFISKMDLTCHY